MQTQSISSRCSAIAQRIWSLKPQNPHLKVLLDACKVPVQEREHTLRELLERVPRLFAVSQAGNIRAECSSHEFMTFMFFIACEHDTDAMVALIERIDRELKDNSPEEHDCEIQTQLVF